MALDVVLLGFALSLQVAFVRVESVDQLVQELAQFPAELPATVPSNGVLPSLEQRRLDLYDQLRSRGAAVVPVLCRALGHSDVQIRRNVALFLSVAGDSWYNRDSPPLAIAACAPALATALRDEDERVRAMAAHATTATGEAGVVAVPALIVMLGSTSESDRNTACIALRSLGPAARSALPALRGLESDPSENVRGFARRAIERIDP